MSFDNPWQWSSTAASNTAITSIDITGTTGKVKDGDNALRAIMAGWATVEAKGADVASAGTLTLGSQRYYHVTGVTTITDIDFTDAVDGRWAWLIFDGALTLTHNSTTLKLPGAANITTAAGDRALFVEDSSDNIICLSYVPSAPVINTLNGQYKFPATQNASADANTLDDYEEGTYSPTWSGAGTPPAIGNGTLTGYYTKVGRMVDFVIELTTGTTSTYGNSTWSFTLPFNMGSANVPEQYNFNVTYFDTSAGAFYHGNATGSTISAFIPVHGSPHTAVSATVPFTWATGDKIFASGSYAA